MQYESRMLHIASLFNKEFKDFGDNMVLQKRNLNHALTTAYVVA